MARLFELVLSILSIFFIEFRYNDTSNFTSDTLR